MSIKTRPQILWEKLSTDESVSVEVKLPYWILKFILLQKADYESISDYIISCVVSEVQFKEEEELLKMGVLNND